MGLLKKSKAAAGGEADFWSQDVPDALAGLDFLWEFLAKGIWDEDGSKRERGTLSVFVDASGLKVMLNDKDAGTVAFTVAEGMEGPLEAAQRALSTTATRWTAAKRWVPPAKK